MVEKIVSVYRQYKMEKELAQACKDAKVAKELVAIALYKEGLSG